MLSAGHVSGTRGSGMVSSATDVLWMSKFIKNGSKDNSLQAVELSGHQTCKLLSSHPFKPFPRRFSGSELVCSG